MNYLHANWSKREVAASLDQMNQAGTMWVLPGIIGVALGIITILLLLGRITYEGFAAAWPKVKNKEAEGVVIPDDFADRMNNYPQFVVSTTLQEVSWNNSRKHVDAT